MSKELPKVYRNNIDKDINNNKTTEYVKNNDEKQSLNRKINNEVDTVHDKVFDILNSSKHFFNIPVIIKTKNKEYNTKIAGKIRNYIVTLDNDVIFIKDILNIERIK